MPPFTQDLVDRLARAESVAVLTGAGISAESGIPTFRDPGGLWQKFKPEELANVEAFLDNPTLVQEWYVHRLKVTEEKDPNAGHMALVDLERMVNDFALITQNVDNLHDRAGSVEVLELHGNLARSFCIECDKPATEAEMKPLAEGDPAVCEACGGLIRPDVVWFGEMLPEDVIEAADRAAHRADVFLSIGTSAVVQPAAGLPLIAKHAGAFVAEINVEPSAIASHLDEVALGKAGEVLPALVAAVAAARSSS